ncbi:hypothetical protein MF672_003915 [Actinomadura sp. ATCC 31491]|uniref:Uncharacterized protein n=1 Tax=Actinomadura luzonensis TaxID=2805427 RepID=A0ABT0FKW4_9ACTN|nr:hypothetical protein [Actinomadura luzonensis]MCK2212950.1 hypothetical protein [Actinomadura luzonensis]
MVKVTVARPLAARALRGGPGGPWGGPSGGPYGAPVGSTPPGVSWT